MSMAWMLAPSVSFRRWTRAGHGEKRGWGWAPFQVSHGPCVPLRPALSARLHLACAARPRWVAARPVPFANCLTNHRPTAAQPQRYPISADNANYAAPLLAVVLLVAYGLWAMPVWGGR
jgi:hypothetical protein